MEGGDCVRNPDKDVAECVVRLCEEKDRCQVENALKDLICTLNHNVPQVRTCGRPTSCSHGGGRSLDASVDRRPLQLSPTPPPLRRAGAHRTTSAAPSARDTPRNGTERADVGRGDCVGSQVGISDILRVPKAPPSPRMASARDE